MSAHNLALVPLLACVVLILIKTKRLTPFSVFILVEGAMQLTASIMTLTGIRNLWLMHFYTPITTLLLLAYYYQVHKRLISIWIFRGAAIGIITFSAIHPLLTDSFSKFNSVGLTIRSSLLLICALSTSILLLEEEVQKDKKEVLSSLYWVNSGILIYHSSSLLILYFGKYIMHVLPQAYGVSWGLHALFSAIMYVCFLIGIWKSPKQ